MVFKRLFKTNSLLTKRQLKRLNFALIGCGAIGERHAAIIATHGNLQAVCDIDARKAKAFARRFDSAYYLSTQALFAAEKTIDVAVVCTPNGLHHLHTTEALKNGAHVLCEKPMAITAAHARKMIAAAKHYNRKLFVVKQNRYNPPVAFVQQLLAQKKLGRVYSFQLNCFWNRNTSYYQQSDWKGTQKYDGGVLFTQFSHFIDLLCWYFGTLSVVKAVWQNVAHSTVSEVDDEGAVLLTDPSGMLGSVHYTINAHKKNMEGSLTIFGEKGTVKIGGQYLNTLEYFEVKGMRKPTLPAGKKANEYGYYQGSMSNHEAVYKNLSAVLRGKTTTYVSGEDGLRSVELIERIYGEG